MTRYLAHLTTTDIAAMDKREGVIILPIGAVEQHGPHLPLLTDTLITTRSVDEALAVLPDEVKAWALPPLSYGKSNEHIHFAGTITLSAATLSAVLQDIAASVARMGFRRLAFVNGHGGNVGVLQSVARDIREQSGLLCFCIHASFYGEPPFALSEAEQRFGIHAGETETSQILHIAPELVHMERALRHFPRFPDSDTALFLTGRASVAWLADDWSPSGIFGDATQATAAKGEALLRASTANLVKLFTLLSRFEVNAA